MNEMFKTFSDVKKEEKISDKTLVSRIGISAVIVIVCLIAMSISAYAYFSYNVSSQVTRITSASYDLAVTPPESMNASDVYVLKNEDAEDKEYIFVVSTVGTGSTASVGYCKILLWTSQDLDTNGNVDREKAQLFYTKPIWSVADAENDRPDTRTLKITVPAGETVRISLVAEWGSCTRAPIPDDGVLPINFEK